MVEKIDGQPVGMGNKPTPSVALEVRSLSSANLQALGAKPSPPQSAAAVQAPAGPALADTGAPAKP